MLYAERRLPWQGSGWGGAGCGRVRPRVLSGADTMGTDAPRGESRADVYYPVILRAVSQLPNNTPEARKGLYERARAAHAGQLRGQQSELEVARERLALETAIRRVEDEATPSQSPRPVPGNASIESAPKKERVSSPLHRPSTASLIISLIFFSGGWAIDFTCMSLYWVARLPRPIGLSDGLRSPPGR